ncbi:hypothetical protein FRB99_007425 [Tulasnella sp. 403]|nr:hypothetical protein FRB99_007425 [Tulasnella sp. 403]
MSKSVRFAPPEGMSDVESQVVFTSSASTSENPSPTDAQLLVQVRADIHRILTAPGVDLGSITAHRVRRRLADEGRPWTRGFLEGHKHEIDRITAEVFGEIAKRTLEGMDKKEWRAVAVVGGDALYPESSSEPGVTSASGGPQGALHRPTFTALPSSTPYIPPSSTMSSGYSATADDEAADDLDMNGLDETIVDNSVVQITTGRAQQQPEPEEIARSIVVTEEGAAGPSTGGHLPPPLIPLPKEKQVEESAEEEFVVDGSPKKIANPFYTPIPLNPKGYTSFQEFYPFYLGQHANPTNRRLHLFGTAIFVLVQLRIAISFIPPALSFLRIIKPYRLWRLRIRRGNRGRLRLFLLSVVSAYFSAWVGHLHFEKNKPATFKHPWYSLCSDFKMLKEVASGKREF